MALAFFALAVIASAPSASIAPARASSSASVRILSGAKVTLGRSADSGNFRVSSATVRTEDGQRRPAYLVEFQ